MPASASSSGRADAPSSAGASEPGGGAGPTEGRGNGTENGGTENGRAGHTPGADRKQALGDLAAQFAELKEYASLLVATRIDRAKAAVRRAVLFAVAGILGLVLLCATVAAGAIHLFQGVAEGLTELFAGRVWLADLLTGVLLLAIVATAVGLGLTTWNRSATKKTLRKYEERRAARARGGRVPK